MELNNYYVYEYLATQDVEINNRNAEIVLIAKGDVYYVGKGTGDRYKRGTRNNECEYFKKECGWEYRKIKDNLTEEEALNYEKELIEKYTANGFYLTNCLYGSTCNISNEIIANIKFLIMLCSSNVIKMSQCQIAIETESYTPLISEIYNDENKYKNIKPQCPDNIAYILNEYNYEKLSDRDIKFGNIKYILNLVDNGILKMTQSEIAKYYEETTSTISSIKNNKFQNEIKSIKPINLDEILLEFQINRLTREEINKGSVMYIYYNFIQTGVLQMTVRDLVRETKEIYGITEMQIYDIKRRSDVELVMPSKDILGKIFYKYYDKNMELGRRIC